MTSMELEAYKAELAREILTTDNRNVLDEINRLLIKLKKKAAKQEEEDTISKEEILAGIDAGLKEVKLSLEGKLKMKTAKELLDEL